jgi:hypothetical protein
MSRTQTVTNAWAQGSDLLGGKRNIVSDNEQNSSSALGVVTNQLVPLAFAEAKLKSIFILSDQDCTLKFNSSGSPTDTINLKAGIPFQWTSDNYLVYPFVGTTGAITALYVTTTVATQFDLRTLTSD